MGAAVCSVCVGFRALYELHGRRLSPYEVSMYQEHLRLDLGLPRWEEIPA